MAGLQFRTGLSASSGPGTQQSASTASEAAWGPGYSSAQSSGLSTLFASSPAVWTFWAGAAALPGLYLLRKSLPADKRWTFDLVIVTTFLAAPVKGLAKLSFQRLSQDGSKQGLVDDLSRAAVWILS